MGSSGKQAEKQQQGEEDVWPTLLPIGVWDAPSKGRLHHWPRRTHHHSHRDNCQCGQILKVCQRGTARARTSASVQSSSTASSTPSLASSASGLSSPSAVASSISMSSLR